MPNNQTSTFPSVKGIVIMIPVREREGGNCMLHQEKGHGERQYHCGQEEHQDLHVLNSKSIFLVEK